MNRKEKQLIRQEILATLDSNCRGCDRVKFRKTKDSYCNVECPVGLKLQELASKLITDAYEVQDKPVKTAKPKRITDPPMKRGRWSDEEVFYLYNHLNHFSIEHLAERLQRSVMSVYCKVHNYKKANIVNTH